jgi:hypothetical protein
MSLLTNDYSMEEEYSLKGQQYSFRHGTSKDTLFLMLEEAHTSGQIPLPAG